MPGSNLSYNKYKKGSQYNIRQPIINTTSKM